MHFIEYRSTPRWSMVYISAGFLVVVRSTDVYELCFTGTESLNNGSDVPGIPYIPLDV